VRRYVVANVEVKVVAERVQYFDANGKLITESLKDYTRKTLAREFASLMTFCAAGADAEKNKPSSTNWPRRRLLRCPGRGNRQARLRPLRSGLSCRLGHAAADPQRAREQVKKRNYFTRYGEQARGAGSPAGQIRR
jgi:type I restriction enzyme, R subunit